MDPAPAPAVVALDPVEAADEAARATLVATLLPGGRSISVGPLADAVDPEVERTRLEDELREGRERARPGRAQARRRALRGAGAGAPGRRPSARRRPATPPSGRPSPPASPRWGDGRGDPRLDRGAGDPRHALRPGAHPGPARGARRPAACRAGRSMWSAPTARAPPRASRPPRSPAPGGAWGRTSRPTSSTGPSACSWTARPWTRRAFTAAATDVREAAEGLPLEEGDTVTQFEALTAIAFRAFAAAGVDAMAVEAGLGGRWDATNVLPDDAAVVLTNVTLEHTEFLGDTEAAIAAEKLAVAPDGSGRLVVGPLTPAARDAVDAECARRGLRPLRYGEGLLARDTPDGVEVTTPRAVYAGLPLALRGAFQRPEPGGRARCRGAGDGRGPRGGAAARRGRRRADARPAGDVPGTTGRAAGRRPQPGGDGGDGRVPAGRARRAAAGGRGVGAGRQGRRGDGRGAPRRGVGGDRHPLEPRRARCRRRSSPRARARRGSRRGAIEDPGAALAAARELAGAGGAVLVAGSLYLLADLRPQIAAGSGETPARVPRARKGIDPTEAK